MPQNLIIQTLPKFYCTAYIESWERGIQNIQDTCKNLRPDEPEYIIHVEAIMVKFNALQSIKVTERVTKKVTEKVTESEKRFYKIGNRRIYK